MYKNIFSFLLLGLIAASEADAARLKDIASLRGVRENQLI